MPGILGLAGALGLGEVADSMWKEGINRSYVRGWRRGWWEVFVSPPVLGWILAVGGLGALPLPDYPDWLPWLCSMSKKLGHVQSFGTLRVNDAAYWAKVEDGRIIRAYGYVDGQTLANEGAPTPEEIALGFDFLDERWATPAEVSAHKAK